MSSPRHSLVDTSKSWEKEKQNKSCKGCPGWKETAWSALNTDKVTVSQETLAFKGAEGKDGATQAETKGIQDHGTSAVKNTNGSKYHTTKIRCLSFKVCDI